MYVDLILVVGKKSNFHYLDITSLSVISLYLKESG